MIGLIPALAALPGEVERAVEVAVIGHRQRRHAELLAAGEQVGQPGRAVEHRVLGVDVEVDERIVPRDSLPAGPSLVIPSPALSADAMQGSGLAPL